MKDGVCGEYFTFCETQKINIRKLDKNSCLFS